MDEAARANAADALVRPDLHNVRHGFGQEVVHILRTTSTLKQQVVLLLGVPGTIPGRYPGFPVVLTGYPIAGRLIVALPFPRRKRNTRQSMIWKRQCGAGKTIGSHILKASEMHMRTRIANFRKFIPKVYSVGWFRHCIQLCERAAYVKRHSALGLKSPPAKPWFAMPPPARPRSPPPAGEGLRWPARSAQL